ncbi:MAG: hypothetical protein SGILL_010529 [Bacillariaceae sp.]
MKFLSVSTILLLASGASAFAPGKPLAMPRVAADASASLLNNSPFFASEEKAEEPAVAGDVDNMSLDEEVEELTREEVRKMKRASNLRNSNGVEYAPWMNITPEEEEKIKSVMKQKAEARRKRQEQEQSVSGALLMDSQAQELSGGGLRAKVIDGEVELTWATNSERSTKGFMIKRRPARTEDFTTIASFEDWGPLASKGPDGGAYSFLDTGVSPGGWVYRVTECETNGSENDICQALVEIQTQEEQRGAVIAAVGIVTLGVVAVVAGMILDPVGGF